MNRFNSILSNESSINYSRRFLSSIEPGKAQYNLESKIALVTASTEGIGFSIAQRLAQSGATVIVSSRKQTNVDRAVKQLHDEGFKSATGLACHVGKADDRDKLTQFVVDKYKGLDIFVSNAAVNPAIGPILDSDESVYDKIMDVNVKAPFLLTKALVPHMETRPGDKAIVYISSFAGYQMMPLLATYSLSKTALIGLSRIVAADCASRNIRVNCVCPGLIKTKFSEALWQNPDFEDEFHKMVMIKRMGKPEEMANVVTFLASEEASYITGESFVAGGGVFSRL